MTFADLPGGASIFLDANPLVYHFASDAVYGSACKQLMTRIENQEIRGFTSTHVLSETAHHLMTLEASSLFGWNSKVVGRLKHEPRNIQKLTNFRRSIEKVPLLGIQVLTIPPDLIGIAAGLSQQIGLLSNDALVVAIMQQHGLTNLASHDGDFDRVAELVRYGPG